MNRDEILRLLRDSRAALDELGVKRVALFGSFARGEPSGGSDIDLLVEFRRPVGLLRFVHVKNVLEEILGRRVDLVTPDALHPALRDGVLAEAVDAA
jgi:predicted nucleotidyltransferase